MIKDRTFEENSEFFSTVFEIGRRHKILNPECMRTDYGKLIHMLMDSQNPDIQRLLEFKLVKKVSWCHPNHFFSFFLFSSLLPSQVTTVYDFLKSADCLGLLKNSDVITATTAIVDKVQKANIMKKILK